MKRRLSSSDMSAQAGFLGALFGTEDVGLTAPVVRVPAGQCVRRWFYRCCDCLSVVASETDVKYRDERGRERYGECGACGGRMEFMGETKRDRLVKHGFECPCDARCTHARGPSCDCRCGGANHGSGAVVPVTYDAGPVPRFQVEPQARYLGEQYRALVRQVQTAIDEKYGAIVARKCRGEYLGADEYRWYLRGAGLTRELHAGCELRTHQARNRRLRATLAEVTPC